MPTIIDKNKDNGGGGNKKNKLCCPQCGAQGDYSVEHKGGLQETFVMCHSCGYKGIPKAWQDQQKDMSAQRHAPVMADGSIADTGMPSNQPSEQNNPTFLRRERFRKNRSKPEKRITDTNPRQTDTEIVRGSVDNQKGENTKMSTTNPFIKQARDFKKSPWGQFMKDMSEENMVFDEGRQNPFAKRGPDGKERGPAKNSKDLDAKSESSTAKDDKSDSFDSKNKNLAEKVDLNSDIPDKDGAFDTVERKEYRSSPKPEDFIPGYKEWKQTQVDQQYDGWLEDHIVNSGGKLIGSNTEKTMNLNEGEREHTPVYPTEAGYEKLLESRHEFKDFTTVIASNKQTIISKSAMLNRKIDNMEKNAIISEEALKNIQAKKKALATKVTASKVEPKEQFLFHTVLTPSTRIVK